MENKRIGLIDSEDYINQLCFSIIGDLEHNSFSWTGDEYGINITINGQSKFIPNEADEEKEIEELWISAKNDSPTTLE